MRAPVRNLVFYSVAALVAYAALALASSGLRAMRLLDELNASLAEHRAKDADFIRDQTEAAERDRLDDIDRRADLDAIRAALGRIEAGMGNPDRLDTQKTP